MSMLMTMCATRDKRETRERERERERMLLFLGCSSFCDCWAASETKDTVGLSVCRQDLTSSARQGGAHDN